MSALELAIDVAAVHRLTRLATADVLTQPVRERIIARAYGKEPDLLADSGPTAWQDAAEVDDEAPKLATLVTCRWCASVWISLGVAVVRTVAPGPWRWLARALALSSASTLLARVEDR